jgi:hypothetical protein
MITTPREATFHSEQCIYASSLGNLLIPMSLPEYTLLPNPRQFHEDWRIRFRGECYTTRSVVMAHGGWKRMPWRSGPWRRLWLRGGWAGETPAVPGADAQLSCQKSATRCRPRLHRYAVGHFSRLAEGRWEKGRGGPG